VKKNANARQEDPKNLLSRFHFFELIIKVCIKKYPSLSLRASLELFIQQFIIPIAKSKTLEPLAEIQTTMKEQFLHNPVVNKLLF
jgi:hypothetical protein